MRHLLNISVVLIFMLLMATSALLPPVMRAQTAATSNQQSQKQTFEGDLELRQQAYRRQHSDSSGRVRPDLWQKGIASVIARKALGPITGVQWAQVGPAPLRIDMDQIFQGAGPDSGEVVDIAIDPSGLTDQTIFIATNDGGIWKSTDAGTTWSQKTDSMPSLSMGAVALDPGNPSIVYAGTGNAFDGGGVFTKGVGIYKSTDGGNTWVVLNPNSIFTPPGPAEVLINRIVLPASNVLLVATSAGLFKSVDGGSNFGSNSPSFNNGLPVRTGFISDLDLDTSTTTTMYASVFGVGIFRSTDSGSTFPTNLFNNAGAPAAMTYLYIALTQSTQPNNQTMYASVQNSLGSFAGLFKSTNAGGSWAVQAGAAFTGAANGGCQCGYDQTVGVDPQNANRVYIGFQELYLSTDGAGSFGATAVTRNKVHWDHHALIFSPQSHWGAAPTRIYVGTDGGIATSVNGGSNWSNINEGIATNLFTYIDIGRGSATNNAYTYGGTQDTGTIEHQPGFTGTDWHLGIDGDGSGVAVDPANPMRVYGIDNGNYIVTNNAGNNWIFNPPGGPPSAWRFVVDPNNSNNIFAVTSTNGGFEPGNQLYRSTNFGVSYQLVNTFPDDVRSIANVTSNSNLLWAGLTDGTVQFTTNALAATQTWTSRTVTGAPSFQPVAGIAIDPINTSTVVVVYSGFSGISQTNRTKHVFRTTDNGLTWNDISGTDGGFIFNNLPDLPLHAVVIDPNTTPHNIIVAGDTGVMRSMDVGATWHTLGVDLPTVDCTSLALDPSPTPGLLRVGSYGRSVFELTLGSCALTCPNNITKSNDPNQCGAIVTFAPTTTGNCGTVTCAPPSGSFFPKGTTTVICLSAGPSCSFTVTVNDTQPPTITCPQNINVAAAASCPLQTSTPVNFTVIATDNCSGINFVCKNQNNVIVTSGSVFPVGTTTVTCTATDTSGNTASCSFLVTVFSACLADETTPGNVVLFNAQVGNAQAGQYRFCCNGVLIAAGSGTLAVKGCVVTISELAGDRKVHIQADATASTGAGSGTAFVSIGNVTKCSILDKKMAGNICTCP